VTRRVAFFTDSFLETNGVALTSRQFAAYARERGLPFFCVHASAQTRHVRQGSCESYELRSSPFVLPLEHDLKFDLLFLRHRSKVRAALAAFQPDIVHITGPSHCGMLGALLAHDLRIPLVASWHTNIHEFGGRRLSKLLRHWPPALRFGLSRFAESASLAAALRFYQLARVTFAPNPELTQLLESRTGRPSFLMERGIDTGAFTPNRRTRRNGPFTIGYVGRLSAEKNVRALAEIERLLLEAGHTGFVFLVIGEGSERSWLRENLHHATLPGLLRGESLAEAYANMDVFLFPSETDTFGNVVLEAFASGVPCIVTPHGGPKFLVRNGVTGFVAPDTQTMASGIRALMSDPARHLRMREAARRSALARSWSEVFASVYSNYPAIQPSAGALPAAALS
jgi:glycosyltransferase involved in cell wall biosynthesis